MTQLSNVLTFAIYHCAGFRESIYQIITMVILGAQNTAESQEIYCNGNHKFYVCVRAACDTYVYVTLDFYYQLVRMRNFRCLILSC